MFSPLTLTLIYSSDSPKEGNVKNSFHFLKSYFINELSITFSWMFHPILETEIFEITEFEYSNNPK